MTRCKGESGGDGLMALPLPSIPKAETLPRSPPPVRTTGTGGVFTSMGENFPWLVLGGQTWLERGAQSRTKGSPETDREFRLRRPPVLRSGRSALFLPGAENGSRSTVTCFAIRAGKPGQAGPRTLAPQGQRSPRLKVIASNGRMLTGSSSFALAISSHCPSWSSNASSVRSTGSTSHRCSTPSRA